MLPSLDIAPTTEIVYMVDAHGHAVGVRSRENWTVGTYIIIKYGRELPPLDAYLPEDETCDPELSFRYPTVGEPCVNGTAHGIHIGVPTRFLGPGTGGMPGI